ncbi:hypothetical protein BH23GEM9_BH23GEM9_17520 [soil metagenome]
MIRTIRATAFALVALGAPVMISAQQSGSPAEVQQLMMEMQQLQLQLQPLQQQALQDSAIAAQQAAVSDAVREAMVAADSTMDAKLDRMEALVAQAWTAQAGGDTERLGAITTEAQQLQPEIMQAQMQALAVPEISERVEAFQTALQRKMLEIDPESKQLLDRRTELDAQIRAALGGGQG